MSVGPVEVVGSPWMQEIDPETGDVTFVAQFCEETGVDVRLVQAYMLRKSEIYSPFGRQPLMYKAYSSQFVRAEVTVGPEDASVPLLRNVMIPGSRKRRRKEVQTVSIKGVLGQRQLLGSSFEHARRCAEQVRKLGKCAERTEWSRAICASLKAGFVTVRVEGTLTGKNSVPFTLVGTVDLPPGQSFLPDFYPPYFAPAMAAMLPRSAPEWSINTRFTAVSVPEVQRLLSMGGLLMGIGYELLRAAALCYVEVGDGVPFILVPGALEQTLRIRCDPVQGGVAFAILKLMVSLPLWFTVSHSRVVGTETRVHATVSPGGIFSVHRDTPDMYHFPRVGIRPHEKEDIAKWRTPWWVSVPVARRIADISVTFNGMQAR